ncbi:MAG: hypothetical protein ABTQ93_15395 [Candidatus Competibacter denitrificans]
MNAGSCFKLSPQDADALGWADLAAADPPRPIRPVRPVADPADEPVFLGTVKAGQRGIHGTLSLDVLLDPAGTWIDIGGYRFALIDACHLGALLKIARAAAGPSRPSAPAHNPPWEGETRP